MNTSGFRPPGGFRGNRRFFRPPPPPDEHRINEYITAREVRVIGVEGEQLGVLQLREALDKAAEVGLDLVEVAPNGKPPVCKILDYGKYKYKEQKKEAEAKKKRTDVEIKELRIRYRTDVGDFEVKVKQAKEFLAEGHKVKFSMRFKGREVMYVDLGRAKFDELINVLKDVAVVDDKSPAAGRQIHITFAPTKLAVAATQAQQA